jgi:hypothetical protein
MIEECFSFHHKPGLEEHAARPSLTRAVLTCAALVFMSSDVLKQGLPDIESLIWERSPLEPHRQPAHMGSLLTFHMCKNYNNGNIS